MTDQGILIVVGIIYIVSILLFVTRRVFKIDQIWIAMTLFITLLNLFVSMLFWVY